MGIAYPGASDGAGCCGGYRRGIVFRSISLREGSYALGATKIETLWRVVIPQATPGILTGMILSMARASGEVAR
ncbi:MAG: ABC transporter permease subunit [Candidatus Brocadiaceae bacterium]